MIFLEYVGSRASLSATCKDANHICGSHFFVCDLTASNYFDFAYTSIPVLYVQFRTGHVVISLQIHCQQLQTIVSLKRNPQLK